MVSNHTKITLQVYPTSSEPEKLWLKQVRTYTWKGRKTSTAWQTIWLRHYATHRLPPRDLVVYSTLCWKWIVLYMNIYQTPVRKLCTQLVNHWS